MKSDISIYCIKVVTHLRAQRIVPTPKRSKIDKLHGYVKLPKHNVAQMFLELARAPRQRLNLISGTAQHGKPTPGRVHASRRVSSGTTLGLSSRSIQTIPSEQLPTQRSPSSAHPGPWLQHVAGGISMLLTTRFRHWVSRTAQLVVHIAVAIFVLYGTFLITLRSAKYDYLFRSISFCLLFIVRNFAKLNLRAPWHSCVGYVF